MCRGVGEVRVEVHTSKIEVGRREILKRAILKRVILMQGVCFVLLTNVLQHMRCVFCIVNKCFAAHAFVYLSIPSSLKAFSFLFFFTKDPCPTTFRRAYNATAENGFMNGISKGLMYRFIDCVAENGVCQEHRETFTV